MAFVWPHLGSEDRFIRCAARIALEWQPVAAWKARALAETNIEAGLNALLALARCGGRETQPELMVALKKFPFDSQSVTQKLAKLRLIELSFIRQGRPGPELAKLAIEKLDRMYPADNELLNRELSQLLIYLEAPDVATKTQNLLDKARTQEEQAHYIFHLRNLKTGWTLQQRRHYFAWFHAAGNRTRQGVSYEGSAAGQASVGGAKAGAEHPLDLLRWFKEADRDYSDGASYAKYLKNIRTDAIATLSENELASLGSLVAEGPDWVPCIPTKERHFVKDWKLADLETALDRVSHGRSFVSGHAAFNDAQCRMCHRFGNEGGSLGPELTAASRKYSRRDILESILEPSKVVSEQYQNYTVVQRNGEGATGRIIDETEEKVVVQPNPLSSERVEFKKTDIVERRPSKISPMPEGLANLLTEDEILDLLAYIESGGNEQAPNFKAVAGR